MSRTTFGRVAIAAATVALLGATAHAADDALAERSVQARLCDDPARQETLFCRTQRAQEQAVYLQAVANAAEQLRRIRDLGVDPTMLSFGTAAIPAGQGAPDAPAPAIAVSQQDTAAAGVEATDPMVRYIAGRKGQLQAVLAFPDGREVLVREGTEITPGTTVAAINRDSVVLDRNGDRRMILLGFGGYR